MSYRYHIGPWQWVSTGHMPHFAPPVGAIGAIDLGTMSEMAAAGSPRGGCFCWTNGAVLDSSYELIGTGDCREISIDAKMRQAFQKHLKYTPQADKLHTAIMDILIGGADPDGQASCKPIMPGVDGWMDLWLPGHGRVKGERFEWGRTPHTAKVKQMLRAEFAQLMIDVQAKRLNEHKQHLRVLDFWCEKFGVGEWKEFVPNKLQRHVPGRVKHATTYSDDFNRANEDPLVGWTAIEGGHHKVVSNTCQQSTGGTTSRYDSDLSSVDHYSQIDLLGQSADGAVARKDGTGTVTFYMTWQDGTTDFCMYKCIAGSFTKLTTTAVSASTSTHQLTCNGSAISALRNGGSAISVTDTAISSGLRCGLRTFDVSGVDNWLCADLAASGTLYTQLERGPRGICRGVYTSY